MRIDVQGAATIRKLIPNAVTIFLTSESEEELVRRLQERKTEDPGKLKMRIATAPRATAWSSFRLRRSQSHGPTPGDSRASAQHHQRRKATRRLEAGGDLASAL